MIKYSPKYFTVSEINAIPMDVIVKSLGLAPDEIAAL